MTRSRQRRLGVMSGSARVSSDSGAVNPSRGHIRAAMRHSRRALPASERAGLADELARRVATTPVLRRARRIAGYLANDGEMDPEPLMWRALDRGKRLFLPVLHGPRLWFKPLESDTRLALNRFGIPEPDAAARLRSPLLALDLVLVPLVAFDAGGLRLGMGGGFYDRTFAARRHRSHLERHRLIGVAYELQRVEDLPSAPWDVPLDGVVTENGLEWFPTRRRTG